MSTSLNPDAHHGAQRESMHEAQALLPGLALSSRVLTMGGMAAALCFSCFRSSGFCGEELSLASLGVLSRLGRGDSNLEPKKNHQPQWPMGSPTPCTPVLCCQTQRTSSELQRSVLDRCSRLGIWAQRQPPWHYIFKQDPCAWLKRLLSPLSLISMLFLANLLSPE